MDRPIIKKYYKALARNLVSFPCPYCGNAVIPQQFENHCEKEHGMNPKTSCVWCSGKLSWKSRKKNENGAHLLACFEKFIQPVEFRNAVEARAANRPTTSRRTNYYKTDPATMQTNKPLCPGRNFFDHDSRYIQKSLPASALETFHLLPVEACPLRYGDENLELAASYVLKYLETKDTHDWLHVMVKSVAFESFLAALDDKCGLLAFSCWCDGGPYREPRHRQHRHFVAVAPKGHFLTRIWPRVRAKNCPPGKYPSKCFKRFESTMHFVNTLGYLSKRRSKCEFSKKASKRTRYANKHFYILTTLPENFALPLSVLVVGGLQKIMHQQFFQNVSVERVVESELFLDKSKYRQRIGDFYRLPTGIVLPVGRDLVPTDRETPIRMHLLNGKTLHFESCPGLDEREWLERQVRGGNCFYDNVADETWTPRPRDQRLLGSIVPRELRIRELRDEVTTQKRLVEEERAENKRLCEENGRQNDKIHELHEENRQLSKKIHEMYEKEIERLISEIAILKNRIENCTCRSE